MANKPDHNQKHLRKYRKDLRNNLTSAESRLWAMLKNRQLDGRKFRRQHSIDNFIVDFYCPKEKLVVELDGQVHRNPIAEDYDQNRTKVLNSYGIDVIRFENFLVFDQPEIILQGIKDKFKK